MRLDKYLANAGLGSRKDVKKLIRSGKITVSGSLETDPGRSINEENADIQFLGEPVCYQKHRYYMLNKPPGYITATCDLKEKTVLELISDSDRRNIFPVGRLDKDARGLLLLTDDGELAHRLLSPTKHVPKVYQVVLEKQISNQDINAFRDGLVVDKEFTAKSAILERDSSNPLKAYVTIVEGKYHQVKRMFAAVNNHVLDLKRIQMGGLRLDGSLKEGEYRPLNVEEMKTIYLKNENVTVKEIVEANEG